MFVHTDTQEMPKLRHTLVLVAAATTMAALQALPGVGPWTAHYIALRALRWPDAFPAGDVALHKALDVQDQPHPQRAAELASQRWRPWRSYAVLRAWARLAPDGPKTPQNAPKPVPSL